jgi:general secretion pathway protein D
MQQEQAPTLQPVLPPISEKRRNSAENAYLTGAKHLSESQFQAAEDNFAHAVALDPSHPEYLAALALAQEHRITDLVQQAAQKRVLDPAAADKLIDQARTIDSTNPRVVQHTTLRPISALVPQPVRTELAGVIVLQHNNTRHSYHQRSDLRTLANQIALDYGFKVALDPDAQSTQPFRIDVDDVSYDDAMSIFGQLTKTILVPLDPHTAIIAEDTGDNHARYDRLVEETFYLPGYAADQMKDFVSIAQTIFDIKQVVAEPLHGAIIARGPADMMDAVERVFADLLTGSSDVMVDVKLYEVNKQHVRNIGVVFPQSINGFSLASEAQSVVSQNSALIQQLISSGILPSTATTAQIAEYLIFVAGLGSSALLANSFLTIGGGATTIVLSAGNVPTLNLALNDSDARTLDDLQLRASDREKVIFKSGVRYPIQTSLFSDIATSTPNGVAGLTVNGVSLSSLLSSYLGTSTVGNGAVIPQIQYQDLGLTVETTPRILHNAEIGMHLDIKVSALAGTSLNGIPILTSRQFSSDLTIHDGETAMMMSDVTDQETAAVDGLPGLSELPGFQNTTNHNGTKITGDLVLMITPHIVRMGHADGKGPYIPVNPHSDND